MPYQRYAMDGTRLPQDIWVEQSVINTIKLETIPNGLVDVDLKEGLVSVIQSANKQPVLMKLGKLLQKNGLTDKQVRESSQVLKEIKLICNNQVSFAYTEEDILRVYENGPQSCMKGSDSVRVYAGKDTAVAYLEVSGKILARAVVCINEGIGLHYTTPYGFVEPIVMMLKSLGYEEGDLEGCELSLIKDGDNIVCPFLDGCTGIIVNEVTSTLTIDSDGEQVADNTNGYLREHACDNCGCVVCSEDDLHYSEHTEEHVCEECFDESHVYINDSYYHKESDSIVCDGNDEYQLSEECTYVDCRDEYYLTEETVYNGHTEEYYLKSDFKGFD